MKAVTKLNDETRSTHRNWTPQCVRMGCQEFSGVVHSARLCTTGQQEMDTTKRREGTTHAQMHKTTISHPNSWNMPRRHEQSFPLSCHPCLVIDVFRKTTKKTELEQSELNTDLLKIHFTKLSQNESRIVVRDLHAVYTIIVRTLSAINWCSAPTSTPTFFAVVSFALWAAFTTVAPSVFCVALRKFTELVKRTAWTRHINKEVYKARRKHFVRMAILDVRSNPTTRNKKSIAHQLLSHVKQKPSKKMFTTAKRNKIRSALLALRSRLSSRLLPMALYGPSQLRLNTSRTWAGSTQKYSAWDTRNFVEHSILREDQPQKKNIPVSSSPA